MRYVIQPFVPSVGHIIAMTADTELEAGDIARAYLRMNSDAVVVVSYGKETIAVYSGRNVATPWRD